MEWLFCIGVLALLIGYGTQANADARAIYRLPFLHRMMGFGNVAWAVLTAVVFVPAGVILAFVAMDNAETKLFAVLLMLVCVSGMFQVRRGFAIPRLLHERDDRAIDIFAGKGIAHHMAVAGVFGYGYQIEAYAYEYILGACLIGAVLAAAVPHAPPNLAAAVVKKL